MERSKRGNDLIEQRKQPCLTGPRRSGKLNLGLAICFLAPASAGVSFDENRMARFVCAKPLIWTDEDKAEIDGCESFEFNELLIYIKEVDLSPEESL